VSYDLYLHEEFMLLALREDAGTVATSESIEVPLAAALLLELVLRGRVELESGGEAPLVSVVDGTPVGDPILDQALDRIRDAGDALGLTTWVERLAELPDLKQRVAQQLCERGILRADRDKVLWLFTRNVYPEIDPRPEQELVERLRDTIFTDRDDVSPRDALLVGLAHRTQLLREKFDRKDLGPRGDRIERIANGSHVAGAAKEVMDALDAAVLMVVIMPAVF
jgi:hypothetical protein